MTQITQNIQIDGAEGRPMLLDFFKADQPNGHLIIFCHGFKGFKDWGAWHEMGRILSDQGFHFIKFNYSHNGTTLDAPSDFGDLEAFGKNTFSKELQDLNRVITWANAQREGGAYSYEYVDLIGHSRSGLIVLVQGMEDERVSSVTTWAGVSNLKGMLSRYALDKWKENGVIYIPNSRTKQEMPLYYSLYEDYIRCEKRLDLAQLKGERRVPMHFIHGDLDTVVPATATTQLQTYFPWAEIDIIKGAGHTFHCAHPQELPLPPSAVELLEKTRDWLLKNG